MRTENIFLPRDFFFSKKIPILVVGVRRELNFKTYPMDYDRQTVPQPSRETRIQQILKENCSIAHEALEELMYEAFLEVGNVLAETEEVPVKAVQGLSAFALQQIRHHTLSGDLADWLAGGADGDKSLYLRDFLNLNKLQMVELRTRYPRAFSKWTPEEDETLLTRYQTESEGGKRIPWGRMASDLERNPNALRLRLEHLGIDLGSEAGRTHRPIGARR